MAKYRIVKTEKVEELRRFINDDYGLASTPLPHNYYILQEKLSFWSGGGWVTVEGTFAMNEDEAKRDFLEKLSQQKKMKQRTVIEEFDI